MNLEDVFLKNEIKDGSFPIGKDYIATYIILKGNFDKNIHPEIKTKILEIEEEGFYNDHGVDHIKMVVDRISKIYENFQKNDPTFLLSNYEIFILLVAANLHDAGHLITTRSGHANAAKELLSRFDKNPNSLLDTGERRIIGDIAKAHGGKNDPIGKLSPNDHISGKEIRPRLLASILRLADELAEDKTRASRFLLHLQDEGDLDKDPINPYSEIFHRFSESVDSIYIEGNVIKLSFCVNSKQLSKQFKKKNKEVITEGHFLLDEIYDRCLKTFLETLYSNRFFAPNDRYTKITVQIYLLDKFEDYLIEPISFVLEESGYPSIGHVNIFEMCKKSLKNSNGEEINGEYIARLIEEKQVAV
ncbi:HD domain-containing protein [Flavobacterium oncorhynchi]|uniref:HD domain-containing protein n=1 Tax=Flavobacterium oncorhynchi TaxID=728056 RepID=UPI003519FB70